ncbi:MAG: hypothetical protein Kow00109_25040 [Acidobacteriota bacterium]
MNTRWLVFFGALLLGLALIPLSRTRAPGLAWVDNPEEAFATARASRRNVVAFLYTDWCSYCRQMDRTTFRDPGVVDELGDRLVWLRLNAENDTAGRRMALERRIIGYPTVIVFAPSGEEITRIPGYLPPERFRAFLGALLEETGSRETAAADAG